MVSGLIGIQVPGNRLWVRVPCPPLLLLVARVRVGWRNAVRANGLGRVVKDSPLNARGAKHFAIGTGN